jgi:CheY-like chemotaxis protein
MLAPMRKRVLVAEDDIDLRRLVSWALRRDGHEVVEARDGVQLLIESPAWSGERVDLILADVRMPDMTALEAVAALRFRDRRTPVVLMTAFGDEQTRTEARALGVRMVLAKPIQVDRLCAVVRRVLSGGRVSRLGTGAPPSGLWN